MMDAICDIGYPVLKHQYVTAGFDSNVTGFSHTSYSKKLERLDDRLYDATILQLTKMEADKRLAGYYALLARQISAWQLMGKSALPRTWRFYDEQVRALLVQTWEEQVKIDENEGDMKRVKA
jgi:hypothetical protein